MEFPQNQVTLIAGENGAGKTSILDALCVCLYGRSSRTGQAASGFLGVKDLINHESDKAVIRVEFENQGHNYVVTREITGSDSDGKLLEDGERKAIGRHVYTYIRNRAIGLDWAGFTKSTVVLQGEMSALTDLQPGKRKEAFIQLFGLDRYAVFEKTAKEKADSKASSIRETEKVDEFLLEEVKGIPGAENNIKRLGKTVSTLARKKVRLDEALNSRKGEVDALEEDHNKYVAQKEKVTGIGREIESAKSVASRARAEVGRLLSMQEGFPVIERSYNAYSESQKKISEFRPAKLKFDEFSRDIDRNADSLREKEGTIVDTRGDIKEAKATISKIARQIPSASELTKAKEKVEHALDAEKRARAGANDLRGQIKTMGNSIEDLEAKKGQVKGKDRCPVCLQKISDPAHVTKHYDDEITSVTSKMSVKKAERNSILRKIQAYSEKAKRLDLRYRDLERLASKADQLRTERQRLVKLTRKRNSLQLQVRRAREEDKSLTRKRERLGFDSRQYAILEAEASDFVKHGIAEEYSKAKTELEKLPDAQEEAKKAEAALSSLQHEKDAMGVELKRLGKIETKYTRARRLLESKQKECSENDTILAREQEKETGARTNLADLREKKRHLDDNRKRIEQFQEERITLEELRDIFKNIPENILRRLRPFIEKEGTDIINDLSDNELTALNIEEETLNVAATTNGEIRPIHYFSGGQKTRINMALRVAISRILSRMPQTEEHTFAIMQTLFIDEGDFGNLDEAGIRDAVNVIRNLTKEFDHVILISHVDTIREIFHGYTVEVKKTGLEESAIEVPVLSSKGE